MKDDHSKAIADLQRARDIVIQSGESCRGFVLMSDIGKDGEEWSAWLHTETGEDHEDGEHRSLFDEIRTYNTAEDAAAWVLEQVAALQVVPIDMEEN